jgi:hypothetical protein
MKGQARVASHGRQSFMAKGLEQIGADRQACDEDLLLSQFRIQLISVQVGTRAFRISGLDNQNFKLLHESRRFTTEQPVKPGVGCLLIRMHKDGSDHHAPIRPSRYDGPAGHIEVRRAAINQNRCCAEAECSNKIRERSRHRASRPGCPSNPSRIEGHRTRRLPPSRGGVKVTAMRSACRCGSCDAPRSSRWPQRES